MTLNTKPVQELAEKPEINAFMLEMARYGLLKFGKLSVPYLMRKLKVSASTAKEIINNTKKTRSDNDSNVASEKHGMDKR